MTRHRDSSTQAVTHSVEGKAVTSGSEATWLLSIQGCEGPRSVENGGALCRGEGDEAAQVPEAPGTEL